MYLGGYDPGCMTHTTQIIVMLLHLVTQMLVLHVKSLLGYFQAITHGLGYVQSISAQLYWLLDYLEYFQLA